MSQTVDQADWNRMVREGISAEGETNTLFPFGAMTKKYGLAFIEYCQAAWRANDGCLSEEEFRRVNGGIPEKFFESKVKAAR